MEFDAWQIWILAAILFVLLEIFVPSFVMISIATGCFFAFGGALFNVSLPIQLILFIAGTTTGILAIKPFMSKYAYKNINIDTNVNGLIGRIGKVEETINNDLDQGCIIIDGDHWKAVSSSNQIIEKNSKVKVLHVNSIVLTVEPVINGNNLSENKKYINNENQDHLEIRTGKKIIFLNFNEIIAIYSNNKITYILSSSGKKYIHDDSLEKLQEILPPEQFFRANRQFILIKKAISEFKAEKNGKIKVQLIEHNSLPESISVSRLKAHSFRKWIKNIL